MKIELWQVGNTSFDYIKEGTAIYEKRLKHFLPFNTVTIPDIKNAKNMPRTQIKKKEGQAILGKLDSNDYLILLDENGKEFTSVQFSNYIERALQQSRKKMIFLIGGAYGFSDEVYDRANSRISLSKMTFSHQMIRIFALEQIYCAMTILKGMPYHHS